MIKDYYKILGVHEDAPEKEIRARWIELMKHYHPDVQKGIEFDEISKEINEAYEILKDPFTRAEYDHDLAQNRCYRRKQVGDRLSFVLLGSVFFVAILYMAIIPRITSVSSVSQSIRRNLGKVHSENDVSNGEVQGKDKVKVEENSINPTDSMNPINQPKAAVEVQDNQINQIDQIKVEDKVKKNSSSPSNSINSTNQEKVEAKVEVENNQINQIDKRNQRNQEKIEVKKNQINQRSQRNQRNQEKVEVKKNPTSPSNTINSSNPTNQQKVEVKVKKKPITQAKPEVQVQKNSINPTDSTNSSNPKNLLVARDEEIKKFFANYVDRYNRKDLIGFMSFFSNRAIQNQKDGLEAIKKIYFTFFNQSLELKYRLSDPKIEICQNAINVKAQYELDQLSRNGRRNAFRGCVQWVLAREGEGLKIVSLDYQQTKGESHEI
jgi:curved DNA-binding protein CbpA